MSGLLRGGFEGLSEGEAVKLAVGDLPRFDLGHILGNQVDGAANLLASRLEVFFA